MSRLFAILFILFPTLTHAQIPTDSTAIRTLLTNQVSEWNRGNVPGYMHGYWENDSLVFIGSKGPTYGYNATLQRYLTVYPDAAHMGHLTSEVVSMQRLSPDYYFLIGKWALTRTAGNISGSWTLLFHKIANQWVIICDHSS